LILIDANILIYAYTSRFVRHPPARDWFDRQLNGRTRVGLPWTSILAFCASSTVQAWNQVIAWLGSGPVWVPKPTEQHSEIFGQLLGLAGIRANLVYDADLAALAIEHGLVLCSTDGDFARFPGLRWVNPIAG
jgi:hypothetical protein